MFLSRNKKNNVYPCKPQFYYIKVGLKGGQNYIGMFFVMKLRKGLCRAQTAQSDHDIQKTSAGSFFSSRKHAYIILTPLNPTFI